MTIVKLHLPCGRDGDAEIELRMVPSMTNPTPQLTLWGSGFEVGRYLGLHETDAIIRWLTVAREEIQARREKIAVQAAASIAALSTRKAAE